MPVSVLQHSLTDVVEAEEFVHGRVAYSPSKPKTFRLDLDVISTPLLYVETHRHYGEVVIADSERSQRWVAITNETAGRLTLNNELVPSSVVVAPSIGHFPRVRGPVSYTLLTRPDWVSDPPPETTVDLRPRPAAIHRHHVRRGRAIARQEGRQPGPGHRRRGGCCHS
jgi:hypothetical protein